jgi:hypothetical protein
VQQIRLCWNVDGRKDLLGRSIDCGVWHPDIPENREALKILMEEGNAADGAG